MAKIYDTVTKDIMLSGFNTSPDELMRCAVGVCTALQMENPSGFPPVVVINEYDDFFGYSVNIIHKYQKKREV